MPLANVPGPSGAAPRRRLSHLLSANLAAIGLMAAAAIFLALSVMIASSFGHLEEAEVQGHIDRTISYLDETSKELNARSKDWGYWDDTFNYLNAFDAEYEYSNINAESFRNALFDGMVFYRYSDHRSRAYYFDRETGESNLQLAKLLQDHVTAPAYINYLERYGDRRSYVRFGNAIYAIASVLVKRSDLSGVSPGYLTVAQKLENSAIDNALQIRSSIDLAHMVTTPAIKERSEWINVAVPVLNRERQPVATVRFSVERKLMATGNRLRSLVGLAVIGLVIVMLLVLNRRITGLVLVPVERLNEHVDAIRATGELKPVDGSAEIAELHELQQAFNGMAEELAALRSQNEAQSFALGKQQSSIGVMHNVRNSLSPVHVILSTLESKLQSGIPPLASRAIGELGALDTPVDRREKLAAYLAAVHDELGRELGDVLAEVREAGRHLHATLEVISASQRKSTEIDYHEPCELAGMLGYAGNTARFIEGADVAVIVDCPQRIVAQGNRVLLVQILENLVINSAEAIAATGKGGGHITLAAALADDASHCIITVDDDGEGFDPDSASQLFQNGFSTRQHKSGGMGLHWCANTINAMGGSLQLTSAGAGQGARAIILLPLHDSGTATGVAA